jgi:hypothetical protein
MVRPRGVPKRNACKREPANRVLVVTEGTETEPRYFSALLQKLGISTRRIIIMSGSGSDPKSVVDTALREQKAARRDKNPFDSVWVVFDTERDRVHLSEAIDKAKAHAINQAVSAPCFEYWFLLHFEYTTRYMTCYDEVRRKLSEHMAYGKGFYDTNLLLSNTDVAVDNAEKVRIDAERTDSEYPRTDVDKLVIEIDSYADEDLRLLAHE